MSKFAGLKIGDLGGADVRLQSAFASPEVQSEGAAVGGANPGNSCSAASTEELKRNNNRGSPAALPEPCSSLATPHSLHTLFSVPDPAGSPLKEMFRFDAETRRDDSSTAQTEVQRATTHFPHRAGFQGRFAQERGKWGDGAGRVSTAVWSGGADDALLPQKL